MPSIANTSPLPTPCLGNSTFLFPLPTKTLYSAFTENSWMRRRHYNPFCSWRAQQSQAAPEPVLCQVPKQKRAADKAFPAPENAQERISLWINWANLHSIIHEMVSEPPRASFPLGLELLSSTSGAPAAHTTVLNGKAPGLKQETQLLNVNDSTLSSPREPTKQ